MLSFSRPLLLDSSVLCRYTNLKNLSSELLEMDPLLKLQNSLSLMFLKSKQGNEAYENLLADVLRLQKVEGKHGWDAMDDLENPKEVYEFKPTRSKTLNVLINDDSLTKIEKTEILDKEGKMGWLVLARIDENNFSFDCIYKFPLDIYHEARRKEFHRILEKNRQNNTQTRNCFNITLKKSIQLCIEKQKTFYEWKRDV